MAHSAWLLLRVMLAVFSPARRRSSKIFRLLKRGRMIQRVSLYAEFNKSFVFRYQRENRPRRSTIKQSQGRFRARRRAPP